MSRLGHGHVDEEVVSREREGYASHYRINCRVDVWKEEIKDLQGQEGLV